MSGDRKSVIEALSGEIYDGEVNIRCPECGRDESHIREVFTRFGTDELEGGRPFPGTVAKGVANDYRRDALVVVFDGECGHAWELILQQHKGPTLIQLKTVGPKKPT